MKPNNSRTGVLDVVYRYISQRICIYKGDVRLCGKSAPILIFFFNSLIYYMIRIKVEKFIMGAIFIVAFIYRSDTKLRDEDFTAALLKQLILENTTSSITRRLNFFGFTSPILS